MIDHGIEALSALLEHNIWFAPMLAILAGALTSVTPCSLSSVPIIIGYVGGTGNKDGKRAFRLSLVFALGMAITYTILGVFASLVGKLLHHLGPWWYVMLGILMVLMAIQAFEIHNFIPPAFNHSKNSKKGYVGAFLAGMLGGLFASHCALPVLVVLLAIVAESGSPLWGIMLLLLYALGHSILVIIAGTSAGLIQKLTEDLRYMRIIKGIKLLIGSAILLLAFFMFYLAWTL
ncbi:MAG: cytochrome c biogenesis protein CcdA [Eubacteriales bacterium]|nr:cytochrome c biogenesis protein CcdA [Eubacteriales bacterium]MDD4583314.1 cytochrome c biogenesis protein CcdA [Eubacteriales bacterium]